jgi:DNA-binding NarL/FixJ family response regulator
MTREINVLIADDHKLLLQSMASVLAGFEYVASVKTCTNLAELSQSLQQQIPQVLFLDINLPPDDGLSICREIKLKYPSIYVIILTSHTEQARINSAQLNGANAYFIKSVDIEAIDGHLRNYLNGTAPAFVTEGFSQVAEEQATYYTQLLNNNILTPREKQIAELLVQGKHHSYITSTLNISYDTFKTHRSNVLSKLGFKSVPELISALFLHK